MNQHGKYVINRFLEVIYKITILGSGGCTNLPQPLCFCRVCQEAREKGKPFARNTASLYIEDIKLLVDTPEDLVEALNYNKIKEIDNVLYSHWDPDHTLGMRIFEQIRLDWLKVNIGIENDTPINVYALPGVCEDIKEIKSKFGSFFDYYQNVRNLIKIIPVESIITIGNIKITFVPAGAATAFVFEQNDKKFVYAPCDVKPFPDNEIFNNCDLMIIGETMPTDIAKNNVHIADGSGLKEELFAMADIVAIKAKYKIPKVIITHLEEIWGLSHTDYQELSKQFDNITFAFDGMTIDI